MTLEELLRIVRRLSNSAWVRYWVHYNWPDNPSIMAIQLLDVSGSKSHWAPVPCDDLLKLKFTVTPNLIYTIQRLDEKGEPYHSLL